MLAGHAAVPHHFVHSPLVQAPLLVQGPAPQPLPCPKGPLAPPCHPATPAPAHPLGQAEVKPSLFQTLAAEVKAVGRGCADVKLSHSAVFVGMAVREAAEVQDAQSEYADVGQMPPIPPCAVAQEAQAEVAVGRPFADAQEDHSAELVAPGRPEMPFSEVH